MNPTLALTLALASPSPRSTLLEWVDVLNTKDPAKMVTYRKSAAPGESALEQAGDDWDLSRRGSPIKTLRYLKESDSEVEALAFLTGVRDHVVLQVMQGPDGKRKLSVRPPTKEERPALPPIRLAEAPKAIQEVWQRLAKSGIYSGAFALSYKGSVVAKGHSGFAHRGFRVRNRWDTKFNLASMGKMFTAAAIAGLVDQKKLSLETKVGDVIPDYPNEEVKNKAAIRHLLSHTSGLPDIFTDEFMAASKDRWRTLDSLLPLFAEKPLLFEPGTQGRYSNAGFVLLGHIIQRVTGEEYWAYLSRTIFNPLGMNNTAAYEVDRDTPNLAFGYTWRDMEGAPLETPMNNLFLHTVKGSPAGGAYSTVPDMLRFGQALMDGKIVPKSWLSPTTEMSGGPGGYGLGFQLNPGGAEAFGHSGGFPGINGRLAVFAKQHMVFVAFTNEGYEASELFRQVKRILDSATKP
jgi:CubicO group peptidase (beta-lactamase class C family)